LIAGAICFNDVGYKESTDDASSIASNDASTSYGSTAESDDAASFSSLISETSFSDIKKMMMTTTQSMIPISPATQS